MCTGHFISLLFSRLDPNATINRKRLDDVLQCHPFGSVYRSTDVCTRDRRPFPGALRADPSEAELRAQYSTVGATG